MGQTKEIAQDRAKQRKPTERNWIFLIAAQNNAIRINYIKAKIDKTQQNCKGTLCEHREETVDHIISEYSKPKQKEYKTKHNWVGKVIYWELCKRFKFGHAHKWYMQKPESRHSCLAMSLHK